MGFAGDIWRSWRAPGPVLARRAGSADEGGALALLLAACALMFVAQWPVLLRSAALAPDVPFAARMGGALFGWLFVMPPVAYVVAALSHLGARAMGGRGTWLDARVALFWAMLAAAPLWMLNGLAGGFAGDIPAGRAIFTATQIVALAGFFWVWLTGLVRLEWS